jgi:hypothetical protein
MFNIFAENDSFFIFDLKIKNNFMFSKLTLVTSKHINNFSKVYLMCSFNAFIKYTLQKGIVITFMTYIKIITHNEEKRNCSTPRTILT